VNFEIFLLVQTAFESKEAYYKALGFQEDNGKIENVKDYLKRLESYMRLYGALVQVCCSIFFLYELFVFLEQ